MIEGSGLMLVRFPTSLDVASVLLWTDELPALWAGRHNPGGLPQIDTHFSQVAAPWYSEDEPTPKVRMGERSGPVVQRVPRQGVGGPRPR